MGDTGNVGDWLQTIGLGKYAAAFDPLGGPPLAMDALLRMSDSSLVRPRIPCFHLLRARV